MSGPSFGKLFLSIGICQAAGLVGSVFTASSIDRWYRFLERPALAPPNWVFGPVWTLLYTFMGVAAFLVWERGFRRPGVRAALAVFAAQLALNALWSFLFFGLQDPEAALIGIALLWLAIVATIALFWRVSRVAGALLVPYLLWVSFAAYLNYAFWRLN